MTEFNKAANDATDDGPTLAQLRSWLGSEIAFGVLDVPTGGADPKVLGFAEVREKAQLEAAITKDKDTRALGKHGDYDLLGSHGRGRDRDLGADTALISNNRAVAEAAIDRLGGTGDRLSDASTFKDTLASLASDNIVVGYAPGLGAAAARRPGPAERPDRQCRQGVVAGRSSRRSRRRSGSVRSFGFSLGATENGLRMRGTTLMDSGSEEPVVAV